METLALKLRPKKIDDVIGQKHLIGKNKILSNLVKNKRLFSMIFYGKPGIGKTTIALALVNELGFRYRMINAVTHSKKDIDIVIEEAKMYDGIVLLVDEIHRLNKDKQDILLPHLESGLITLIGMTTANPYHKINPAIRSRCQIFELHELGYDDIKEAIEKIERKKILKNLKIDDDAKDSIINSSSGDLRHAYNLIEMAYYSSSDQHITLDELENMGCKPIFFHDANEDGYYDVISALQKSIRGSDVDASLHYLARLIEAGDLDIICRRLNVIAYEDIGLANPNAGLYVDAAINSVERLGLPEARIILANIVILLALSPKSNSAYLSIDSAISDIKIGNTSNVPNNIKTTSKDYLYPHDYPNHFVKQQYMPDNLIGKRYYKPQNNKYENNLKAVLEKLEKLKDQQ